MRLKQLAFSDIYVSAEGEADIRTAGKLGIDVRDYQDDAAALAARLVSSLDERSVTVTYDGVSYRATRIDSEGGWWWGLRRLEVEARPLPSLGLRPDVVRRLREAVRQSGTGPAQPSHGLLLIAGKTNVGKTTTAASVLREWLEIAGDLAITLESPPEMPLRGRIGSGRCHQIAVEEDGFADAFADCMRSTPRYIGIGEIRGVDAARLAIRAPVSGHLVVGTIHAGSLQQALMSLLQIGQFPDLDHASAMLADGLLGVIYQSMSPGSTPRLETETLFVDNSDAIRAKIRGRQFGQLKDDVLSQAAKRH